MGKLINESLAEFDYLDDWQRANLASAKNHTITRYAFQQMCSMNIQLYQMNVNLFGEQQEKKIILKS